MDALASPAQLSAFLQQPLDNFDASALLMLDIASGMVRDFLQQDLTPVVNDVLILDPVNAAYAVLPELPVTGITLVEVFDGTIWTPVLPAFYTASKRTGVVSAVPNTGYRWPADPESWRVTYSHGFATIPSSIIGVVLGVAARAYASPAGVDSERIGGYQVKYGMEADGFSSIERKGLARYMNPRIA